MTSSLDHHYWDERWQNEDIGWHQREVSPSLVRYWSQLALNGDETVLVPFCGKSLDMLWLAERGHYVLGVEWSGLAVRQFFQDNQLAYHCQQQVDGKHYIGERIEIIEADVFQIAKETLRQCAAVYDRAAMVAQNAAQRQRYAAELYGKLPTGCRALLLVIDYPQAQRQGPPFAVAPAEIQTHYATDWSIDVLEQADILAHNSGFQAAGVDYLHSGAYAMVRR